MPVPPEPEIQSAARLLAEGRPADAASRLAALVAEAPTYAAAHVLRATALEAAGLIDDALVSWGRAAALVPRSALVHRERARLLASQIPDDVAPSLPPPVPASPPAPTPEPAPHAHPAPDPEPDPEPDSDPGYDDDYADGPLLGFGEPSAVAPPPAAGAPEPSPALWGDETGLAPVLPPEAREAADPAPAAPPPPDVDAPTEGWSVVDESDVPAPPPSAFVSPDVIAPEGDLAPPPEPATPLPEATVEDVPRPMPSVADELDSLIAQLEDAPRIKPDPAYAGPTVDPDAGNVDDLASETLAKIYAAQHQYVEAALMYEKLAARTPESAEDLLERAAELRRKSG